MNRCKSALPSQTETDPPRRSVGLPQSHSPTAPRMIGQLSANFMPSSAICCQSSVESDLKSVKLTTTRDWVPSEGPGSQSVLKRPPPGVIGGCPEWTLRRDVVV